MSTRATMWRSLFVQQLMTMLVLTSSQRGIDDNCNSDNCQAPDCYCAGLIGPSGLTTDSIPQMVMLTFDDAVLADLEPLYKRLFNGRRLNPNGCPIVATFYVTHNATDYGVVRQLYDDGHEMASHSVTHRLPHSNWTRAGRQQWLQEIGGERYYLTSLAGVSTDDVRGMRAPFLETGGDAQFEALSTAEPPFEYDSSFMVGPHGAVGGAWPFTLHRPPTVEFCSNNNCPRRPHPTIWELPLNRWIGRDGRPCAMVDSCDGHPHSRGDALAYFWYNFGRFYRGNRAPFGIHLHANWLRSNPGYLDAFETFVNTLLTDMNDVYFVTGHQVIEWMRNPQTIDQTHNFEPWKTSCHQQSPTFADRDDDWNTSAVYGGLKDEQVMDITWLYLDNRTTDDQPSAIQQTDVSSEPSVQSTIVYQHRQPLFPHQLMSQNSPTDDLQPATQRRSVYGSQWSDMTDQYSRLDRKESPITGQQMAFERRMPSNSSAVVSQPQPAAAAEINRNDASCSRSAPFQTAAAVSFIIHLIIATS